MRNFFIILIYEINSANGLRIRKSLESKNKITLANNPKIGFHVVPISKNEYDNYKILAAQIKKHDNNSLLIICPRYKEPSKNGASVLKGKLTDRIKIKQMVDFKNEFTIIDAFDANTDYSLASVIDTYLDNCKKNRRINRIARFYDILVRLHLKMSEIDKIARMVPLYHSYGTAQITWLVPLISQP